ncbi:hypothetical protein KKE45_01265, partial [Patescibacteria group bacterium]|nr:hypothetical protein [Patescibacteria group bacterium]
QINISEDNQTSSGHTFQLSIADATINGRVVNAETLAGIGSIYGYAFAEPSGSLGSSPMMGMGMGGPINNSAFTIKVPAGDYTIGVDFPPQTSGYTPASTATVTAIAGQTVTVDVPVTPNNATITINFKDNAGDLITNLSYAEVFMHNGAGGHQWRMLSASDLNSGSTNILVGAGTWNIGYHINSSTDNYMSQPTSDNTVTAIANDTVTTNITLQAADSTIAGTVYDPDGNTLAGVWISTDSRKTTGFNPMGGPMFMNGVMTDANGTYSLTMPAGTYQVAAFFPPSAIVGGETVAYLNPKAQEVTISSTSPATTNFTFTESDATITGNITLAGNAQGAFISAYSNNGGYNETTSTDGSYSLNVTTGSTWYIKAFYETGTAVYYSAIYQVDMNSATSATQNMAMAQAPFTIPQAVSTTFNCANAKKITLNNNAEISIPASAIKPSSVQSCDSTDTGSNITITVSPTAQMSLQDKSIPIGVGYEITAKDSNGSVISDTFASNVTINIPYSVQQITEAVGGAMDESLLGNGYWDTSTSSWRSVDSQVVNTTAKTLTISTNHFTLFGVLAATDPSSTSTSSTSAGVSSGTTSSGSVSKPMAPKDIGSIVEGATNKVFFMLPANSLKWDANFDIKHLSNDQFTTNNISSPTPPLWIASGPYKITMKAWWNNVVFTDFEQPVTLIFRYDPTALGEIPENSLRLNYFDQSRQRWQPLNSLLVTDRHEIAVVTEKIHGTYAIIGGFGNQYFVTDSSISQTVTAQSTASDIGLTEKILESSPTPEEKTESTTTTQDTTSRHSELVSESLQKKSWFGKLIDWVKKIF